MLYIVFTPIGHLKDITCRAVETLKSVDLIAAEKLKGQAPKRVGEENMKKVSILTVLFLLLSRVAQANLVWPALYVEQKVSSIPIIALSLLMEFMVIKKLFAVGYKASVKYTVLANLASGVIGLILRPLSGIVWEFSLGALVMLILDWGSFNPVAWFFVLIIGGALNAFIELWVIKLFWKEKKTLRNFSILWLVNWVTVGLATLLAMVA